MRLLYCLHNGKNIKWCYYVQCVVQYLLPAGIFRARRVRVLAGVEKREDYPGIVDRVNYYNKLDGRVVLPGDAPRLSEHQFWKRKGHSVYFFDTYMFTRWFPRTMRWCHVPGDVVHVPDVPSIVKSRPLVEDNACSVLLNLNKVRHFIFIKDDISFEDKLDMVVFRGKVGNKLGRRAFMEKYFGCAWCNLGDVGRSRENPAAWKKGKMTLREHLKYKFIMTLEGNDVASNLKWVMSSNSIAVMPRPTCETWFMEGRLIPGYHYIEIRDDFSDLAERVRYYAGHPGEALRIVEHAHAYVASFQNKRREKLISLLVMKKYFDRTN